MRWRRALKRVLVALMFLCMTIKIQLELKMLDSTKNDVVFAPWWSNETAGHLRAFPKVSQYLRSPAPTHLSSEHFETKENLNKFSLQYTSSASYNVNNRTNTSASELRSDNKPEILRKDKDSVFHSNVTKKHVDNVKSKHISVVVKEKVQKTTTKNVTQGVNTPVKRQHTSQKPATIKLTKKDVFAKLDIWDNKKKVKIDKVNTDFTEVKKNDEKTKIYVSAPVVTKENKPKPKLDLKKILPPKRIRGRPVGSPNLNKAAAPRRGVSHEVDSTEVSLSKEAIIKIKVQLKMDNNEQKVHNQDRYGPVHRNTSILLVQVHNRLGNLRYLVESMKAVRGIQEALVIFSHDLWDPAMNAFVRNITDFRVMQIFFPFSIQLHPFAYPGRDPRDCNWNSVRKGNDKCLNHRWPDTYGHYREASFTQIKHHWWWKIHRVFEGLEITKTNYTGHVVFLEDDHYVLPDLLHVLGLMKHIRHSSCDNCQVLSLGNYNKMSAAVYKNFVEKGDWWVTKYNLGFALDSVAWNVLTRCKTFFCDFDDYNWDWTLNNLVQTCLKPRMSMLSVRLTRVLHVGSW
ncbi:alpha-1,6-mannosyl-glycoprotein 2-beta-N-acetylglucosaminyltransferase-like isoform X2 [Homarus americanus]|uniref:alpha-1,6-mannosyl-glycoprotein 2-beta-N-acetylglucosaminyltransferase-like isoform X2 n=1 Tax=Homarus americanus TaxID=6706 RepID=UPI001C43E08F|nr:alpha-1,6-mannosyl-glycoprotein 2-beta-N-acetylglucosaminyltransferase-like isoform X2 [Homarus americanus]